MVPWTDDMLGEIERCGKTLHGVRVITHIDRCMCFLHDESLIDCTKGLRMLIQMNGSFFLHRRSRKRALKHLLDGDIHFLGSDCRNLHDRGPNLGYAADVITEVGLASALEELDSKVHRAITGF